MHIVITHWIYLYTHETNGHAVIKIFLTNKQPHTPNSEHSKGTQASTYKCNECVHCCECNITERIQHTTIAYTPPCKIIYFNTMKESEEKSHFIIYWCPSITTTTKPLQSIFRSPSMIMGAIGHHGDESSWIIYMLFTEE